MEGTTWRTRLAHPGFADAATVLACLFLAVLALKGHWSALPAPVIALTGLAASVAQWPRRRWPLVAAIAGAAGYALSGNPGPLFVGLYSAGSYATGRRAGLAGVAGWVGFAGWAWIEDGRLSWSDAIS